MNTNFIRFEMLTLRTMADNALGLHSDFVCVRVALGAASKLYKVWRNDSGSTGKQKTFKRDSNALANATRRLVG